MGISMNFDLSKAKKNYNAKLKKAQCVVDNEVLRRCDPLVPMDTGMLKKSGITGTTIGSGVVTYTAPYAKRQYYENSGNGNHNSSGLRGPYWFERMKSNDLKDIKKKVSDVFE